MTIRWRAFELRPAPVPLPDPRGDYLTDIWRDHVYPVARSMNMPLRLPPVQPRSRLAHEAAKWAATHGRFEEYNLALFRAFFASGFDIGNKEVLAQLAVDVGLDPDDLAAALDQNVFTAAVIADEDEARMIGVNAVPAFVVGGRVVAAGIQTSDRLLALLSMQPR